MAIDYWHDMSILVDGLEVATHAKDVNLSTEVAPLDVTPMSTTGYVALVGGLKTGNVSMSLMNDLVDDGVDERLFAALGVGGTVKSIVSNSADGSKAYTFKGISLGFVHGGDVGDVSMTTLTGRQSGSPVVRGRLLHPGSTARTSSSTGTGRQLGAVAAGKSLYASLHVLTVSGTSPTLDVKVQSDDNGSFTSATDRITFTQANAKGGQWSSVAGAITDDYWRISYTIGGSATPTFAFAVVAGVL